MSQANVAAVQQLVDAVKREDLATIEGLLDPAVRWHGAGDDIGGCHDRAQALEFIRQALANGAQLRLEELLEAGEQVVARLGPAMPSSDGIEARPHANLITLRDGLITEIVVYPDLDQALSAAARVER